MLRLILGVMKKRASLRQSSAEEAWSSFFLETKVQLKAVVINGSLETVIKVL